MAGRQAERDKHKHKSTHTEKEADKHTQYTPDEQYSHISIFSLLAAPMLIGCPIERLDDFTLNILSNDA